MDNKATKSRLTTESAQATIPLSPLTARERIQLVEWMTQSSTIERGKRFLALLEKERQQREIIEVQRARIHSLTTAVPQSYAIDENAQLHREIDEGVAVYEALVVAHQHTVEENTLLKTRLINREAWELPVHQLIAAAHLILEEFEGGENEHE